MMRYIHTKHWDAKLCEALVTKHMKPTIVEACPNIQIGGIPKASSVEPMMDKSGSIVLYYNTGGSVLVLYQICAILEIMQY
jgi:hypothetical protein